MAHPPSAPVDLHAAQRHALLAVQRRGTAPTQAAPPYSALHIHFHPDWLLAGIPTMALLARSGRYLSQFESGTSNGSYSPEPGGQRWRWEHDWFDGAYDNADAALRPVYGAVDLQPLGHAPGIGYGAAPRFGSAYLALHSAATARSSFCDPDSYWGPQHAGLWPQMDWQRLQCLALPDPLDHYVEAHIHGGLLLARDVAAIVLDPSFRGSATAEAAARTGVAVRYHGGYRLQAAQLPAAADYRGADIAEALADMLGRIPHTANQPAILTPAELGRAQASGRYAPQVLKKAWHCLARWGATAPAA